MNKVTCNLCGTSYPENAAQCPICGEVRSVESSNECSGSGTYTYVKGGRFSKANVKKRNRASGISSEPVVADTSANKGKKKNTGLVVIIIVLLLAIIAVLGYIAFQLFVPSDLIDAFINPTVTVQKNEDVQTNTTISAEQAETEPDLSCKKITLGQTQIQADSIGSTVKLSATPEPANTTDEMLFSSSDIAVATVLSDGTITFTGEGSAVITVSCGSVSAECLVSCIVPTTIPEDGAAEPAIVLNRKEITFNQEGQTWLLYSGEIPVYDILWMSDDHDVATIEDGKVTAIGNGDTMVYAVYNDQTVSCIIHCDFSDTGDSGGITEADGDTQPDDTTTSYRLYNPYGYAEDVTLFVGDQFTLQLVDADGNEVTDAQWKSADESICTYTDGIVEAINLGTTEIIATYEGVDYICTVRIIEP